MEKLESDEVKPRQPWDPQVEDEPAAQTVAPPAPVLQRRREWRRRMRIGGRAGMILL